MKQLGLATRPLSWLYGTVLHARHYLYDNNLVKSNTHESIFLICVGNLSLGGTGKTPTTEFLIKKLKSKYNIAVLSRGYGRKTKGFLMVDNNGTAEKFGDEPLQIAKNNLDTPVAVCENRWEGVKKLEQEIDGLELIILDDAFQHRKLNSDFNLLLTPFHKPYFRDYLLPSGGLRDVKSASLRADMLLITKAPSQISLETRKVFQRESGFTLEKELFFSHLNYAKLYNPISKELLDAKDLDQALVITGIANPKPFENWLANKIEHIKLVKFKDHHHYSLKDIKSLHDIFNNFATSPDRVVITTEKDYVKLAKLKDHWPKNWSLYLAPISIEINNDMETRMLDTIIEKANLKLHSNDG